MSAAVETAPNNEGAPAPEAPAAASRSSGRVRKPVEHFKPEEPEKKDVEPFVAPAGRGEPLGDIANVERRLAMTNSNEPLLKKLHRFCFPGGRPLKATIKKQLRQFKGWEVPADEDSFKQAKLKQLTELDGKNVLKPLCQLLDVDVSGTKAAMAERIYNFLREPSESGKAFRSKKAAAGTKRKAASSSSKSKSSSGSTRGPSAYFLFQKEVRADVVAANPGVPVTEIAKLVGARWGALSDAEKEAWKAKAAKLKPAAGEEGPAKKKQKTAAKKPSKKAAAAKKPSKKKAESEEEDDEDEEDEDDEEEQDDEEEDHDDEEEEKEDEDDGADPELRERLTAAIKAELEGKDLEKFKLKDLNTSLQGEFGEDLVKANKELIKDIVQSLM